ncbi:hypothetical protein C474_05290 [Halogeometricum pallidum JCM 14848]|uniref:DUF7344 domain-containing protein n=1 Tax=Halogeometricum pallidum JCM 14848 TaxID=1227487 RepID=M0DF95_HALPD|nr:hypothetical protein [Halogeometricum pallidum]ELZ33468.1 hypothetical protein C474_05290 [Halogeometricum pallidum JCM 14848]
MDSYDPATLSKDEAYEFASNERRRSLIRTLIADGAQPLSRVVDEVVPDAYEESFEDSCVDARRNVRIALGHTDIPRLDAGGVVDYDYADEVVAPDDRIEELEPLV